MPGSLVAMPTMLNSLKSPITLHSPAACARRTLATAIAIALSAPIASIAQQSAQSTPASGDSDAMSVIDSVVVTGSARAQRRFDASYAANSLSAEDVQKLAPKSFADLLANVP